MTQAQFDQQLNLLGAHIQHGPANDRIYLISLGNADPGPLLDALRALALQHGYGKIIAKLPEHKAGLFLAYGFSEEARIPNFYQGQDAVFLARYQDKTRQFRTMPELDTLLERARADIKPEFHSAAEVSRCREEDLPQMARLYSEVFPSYPFPIEDPEFLRQNMASDVDYFGIRQQGQLIALASAEKDPKSLSAEMTDFATLPQARGQGYARTLLAHMEQAIFHQGYRTAYTIARAVSVGMNRTFAAANYRYGGRLHLNTQIGGQIESMNLWHKSIA
ncbi:putative beta-lysine N-acetyltransferase [Shewanella algae]|uniref:Putative beta-lysine N-acetyltransferase n=1 Tax=Shewanella algae TaxID=38313 RepID=A0A7T8EAK5_9GAMM|nr:putative beta-lysine N-acetyltransferase [Shewanella algae]